MGIAEFALQLGDAGCAVALGGCRVLGPCSFAACAHDVVLFDGDAGGGDTVARYAGAGGDLAAGDHDYDGGGSGSPGANCGVLGGSGSAERRMHATFVVVRHASLSERDSGRLLQYDSMRVVRDPSWDLRAMLRRIASKRELLYRDYARNSLLQSMFYCQRVRASCRGRGNGGNNNNNDNNNNSSADGNYGVFASCWQKSASLCLADAICSMNRLRPSPSHMLEMLRRLPKNAVNGHLSTVIETLGVERATPTLLRRMAASTAGFADHVAAKGDLGAMHAGSRRGRASGGASCPEGKKAPDPSEHISDAMPLPHPAAPCRNSEPILGKCAYLMSESLLPDCYFYLGYTNKENMSRVPRDPSKGGELSHMLKVAFDVDMDTVTLEHRVDAIHSSCRDLLSML